MIKEPLKNKSLRVGVEHLINVNLIKTENPEIYEEVFAKAPVRSAVAWLKQELETYFEMQSYGGFVDNDEIIKKVVAAFPDTQQKEVGK